MTERVLRLRLLLLLAFSVLVVRLVHLQLVRGAYYYRLADQNRLRLVPEAAPRGLLVDRQGRVLATNHTVFRVAIVPQEVEDFAAVASQVSTVVHRPVEALRKAFLSDRSLSFIPATIVSTVPKESAIQLEEERWRLPGLLVRPEVVRHYPLGTSAAHLIGYLSQPTAEQFPLLKQYGVRPKQLVGRMGLEQLLDHALRGQAGGVMVEVDHRGRQVRVLGQRPPTPGATVALTIDMKLQSLIEATFEGQPGAAVVLDPESGAVLAMVSVPAFPPAAFADQQSSIVRQLLADPASPLMNRATSGTYLPGSIMKLITASAALERKVITPETTFNCPGSLTIGDRVFHCWNRDGHGPVNLREALKQSCNVYFMQVAMRVGTDGLRAAQEQVGLSRKSGWPLEEQPGHLPRRRLTKGETALLGIGQGEILITPMQAAVMAAVFANGGWVVEPWVIHTVGGQPLSHRPGRRRVGWSPDTLAAVRTGMRAVVGDPDGTGHRAFSRLVSVAGKTGTAQTHVPGRTHGWFVGFCPVEHPRVAMAIVAEYGGSGGELPAEVARTVCEYVSLPEAL